MRSRYPYIVSQHLLDFSALFNRIVFICTEMNFNNFNYKLLNTSFSPSQISNDFNFAGTKC